MTHDDSLLALADAMRRFENRHRAKIVWAEWKCQWYVRVADVWGQDVVERGPDLLTTLLRALKRAGA